MKPVRGPWLSSGEFGVRHYAVESKSKYSKTHTCEGDPVRANLRRDGDRWRVTSGGKLIGWVGLRIEYPDTARTWVPVKGAGRHWRAWAPSGERVYGIAAPTRRAAVEALVRLSNPKHKIRRQWSSVHLLGPPSWRAGDRS